MEVTELPKKITYFPKFITEDEEEMLMRKIYDSPKTKWTQLSNRRLQNWGGLPQAKGMIEEPLPTWLQTYMSRIADIGAFGVLKPNHCLVNEYLRGQGIMPHEDGDLFYPTVSTITIGSHGVLDFYRHLEDSNISLNESRTSTLDDRYIGSVLLERRSLVLVQELMYTSYLHGIKEVESDALNESIRNIEETIYKTGDTVSRGTRISLTIRHVNKSIGGTKLRSFFGKQR
ncbi:alpha-ketoglutarate-dependent dioxygenase alkB homolog 6-like [Watersipora subatra]|uniref:alpha-ketoglutarate-dependent dioxygenase alkB homolog 6-like n=1 Tax=Watersipora subatra TaxID=2589382 RepID=UPI00355BE96D